MAYASLKLWLGVPSAASIGNLLISSDPIPEHIDLLNGNITVYTENSQTTWSPKHPALKNGGIWSDPVASDGRDLLIGQAGNVMEDMQLICVGPVGEARAVALGKLAHFALMAREFQQSSWTTKPVYLELQAEGSAGKQYSLVHSMDITADQDVLWGTNSPRITLGIEREPYWRALPPFSNPKIWAFQSRGLEPTPVNPSGANEYNYTEVSLINYGNAKVNIRQLIEAQIYNHNDTGVASRINYVDIPAASIPGDAPALAMISYGIGTDIARGTRLYVARCTVPDINETIYAANTLNRQRNTMNGGDATAIYSPAGITTSKLIDANGVLSNGSLVDRYVLQMTYTAAAAAWGKVADWVVSSFMYARRWHIFFRGDITAGNDAEVEILVRFTFGNEMVHTETINLAPLPANYGLIYMGVVDASALYRNTTGGTGRDTANSITISLHSAKLAGVATNLKMTDLILMPADEPMNIVEGVSGDFRRIFLDTTGYFSRDEHSASYGSNASGAKLTGSDPILLIPNVRNRLYFLNNYFPGGGGIGITETYRVGINIVPRWAGVRYS